MNWAFLLDTGPLVASLNARDAHHSWASRHFAAMHSPVLTCEPVLTEACFLLRSVPGGVESVFGLLQRKAITIAFHLDEEHAAVHSLWRRYRSVPMSLADACLVRMSELLPGSVVFTLDSDFRIYRRHRRHTIALLTPERGPS